MSFFYSGFGTMTFFNEIVEYLAAHGQKGATITEIGNAFKQANNID